MGLSMPSARSQGPRRCWPDLSRYTHRVAIANSRLLALDERGVTFRWKDYRAKGRTRHKTMTLSAAEFMRRFLLHVLPSGFHRIRHYGLLAHAQRRLNIATARALLQDRRLRRRSTPTPATRTDPAPTHVPGWHCGAPMLIIETFTPAHYIRGPPALSASP